ncbi:hypothetical protein V6N13_122719 [Hibiscus sabdariffa]
MRGAPTCRLSKEEKRQSEPACPGFIYMGREGQEARPSGLKLKINKNWVINLVYLTEERKAKDQSVVTFASQLRLRVRMRAIPFSLQYSQSHLLLSLKHVHNTSLSLFPPFSNPIFRPSSLPRLSSFSNTRIYTQTKAKKAEIGNGNNSLPGSDPDPSLSQQKLLQVVLVSPQIPGNAGCIARTCAASAVALHLVGFLIAQQRYVVVRIHNSWAEFQNYFKQQEGNKRLLAFTKRGTTIHSDFSYRKGDYLIFGSETCGLPPDALLDCKSETYGGGTIRIPMVETHVRSLNLSVSVGIALYEASRQLNYEQIQEPSGNSGDCQQSFLTEDIFA